MVDSHIRIAGAFIVGGTLVAGAFVLGSLQKPIAAEGALVTAPADTRSFIQVADTDADGIPDWRDALQKTDPIVLGAATSTYEKPTTVTGKFAVRFLEDLLRSKTYGEFGATQEELVEEMTKALAQEASDVLLTEKDLSIIDSADAHMLRSYGNHIATIALSQSSGPDNEVVILQDALRYDKKERLNDLEPIAAAYASIVKHMLEAPVPEALVKEHLDLLNAYNAIREDVRGMQKLYEDPMYTFVRLKRYEDDVLGMSNALNNLFSTLYLKNIEWNEDEPASKLISVIENI